MFLVSCLIKFLCMYFFVSIPKTGKKAGRFSVNRAILLVDGITLGHHKCMSFSFAIALLLPPLLCGEGGLY